MFKQGIISLFGWHLVFGTKNIQFLPFPERLAFSTYAIWSEQRRCFDLFVKCLHQFLPQVITILN